MDDLTVKDYVVDNEKGSENKIQIHWLKFSFIVYFIVCGGAFGRERLLNSYPAIALLLTFIVPFIWALPTALITAELGLAMPSNEGMFLWIKTAFGEGASFVCAICYWIYYSLFTSSFAVLIIDYLSQTDKKFGTFWWHYGTPIVAIILVTFLNLLGANFMSYLSGFFGLISISPIVILFVYGLVRGEVDPKDWIILPPVNYFKDDHGFQHITAALNLAVWGNSGYDSVGSVVEQIKDPEKNLFKSFILIIISGLLTYGTALIGTLGQDKQWLFWHTGTFAFIALGINKGLGYFTIGSSMISNFAGTMSSLLPNSNQLCSLGAPEYLNLPFLTYKHPKLKTNMVAILVNGLFCCILVVLPYTSLVEVANLFYCSIMIAMTCAYIKLSYSYEGKQMPRPFKAAKTTVGFLYIAFFPIFISLLTIAAAIYNNWISSVVAIGFVLLLFIVYKLREHYRLKHNFGNNYHFEKKPLIN
eukprot:TRINITY_DN12689_c0_g1_i1.p1 TRINITY_DN12689_c0_g1~~TRINITY_DN12689_c0_g1_i1.p1  ORF type:complete len:473 (-),score=93.97 TRINITY_DN12689_c0_g1_i1:143-1561(-)